MIRIGRLTVFLLPVLLTMVACSGGGGSEEDATQTDVAAQTEEAPSSMSEPDAPGRPMIPPPGPDAVEGLLIAPYFDAEGTLTEMAISPGQLFSVYICIDHPGYAMKTAQWRMSVPDGIRVLGEKKAFPEALSIGTHENMYVITYPCQTGEERVNLLEYTCMASEDFQGGEFSTVKARALQGYEQEPPFIGFVTCGVNPEQVPSYGGSAVVTRK